MLIRGIQLVRTQAGDPDRESTIQAYISRLRETLMSRVAEFAKELDDKLAGGETYEDCIAKEVHAFFATRYPATAKSVTVPRKSVVTLVTGKLMSSGLFAIEDTSKVEVMVDDFLKANTGAPGSGTWFTMNGPARGRGAGILTEVRRPDIQEFGPAPQAGPVGPAENSINPALVAEVPPQDIDAALANLV